MACMPPQKRSLSKERASGFSLVEVLVAAMLLAISASAALTLFSTSDILFTKSKTQDDDQLAINADLAEIQRRNRRFSCVEGSCTLSNSDPNEDQYTPAHPGTVPPGTSFESKMADFSSRCTQPQEQASDLVAEFETTALGTLPAMTRGITREFDISTPSSESPPTPHAYIVIYSKGNQVLRRVRMVPTVANWCP